MPSRTSLILAFATIYLVWGSTYLGIRVAVGSMPPFAMACVRFLLAGLCLFAWLKMRGAPWPSRRQLQDHTIIGTFLLLGGNGLVVWAEQFIPSGVAALIIGVGPLFIVLTEWAWPGGTRPTAATIGALLLGLVGVAWLAAPWESMEAGGLDPRGLIAVLCACGFWAIGSIYSRHCTSGATPLNAAALQMLGGGTSLAFVAWAHGDWTALDLNGITPHAWAAFIYLIIFGSLLGFTVFVWLMKHSTPARVATYAYVNPVVAVFLGWLLLDEPVTWRTLISSAIIITAVVLITVQKSRSRPAPLAVASDPSKAG